MRAWRRSSSGRGGLASTASRSCCRRTPGRRTTSATSTGTASATAGTRTPASRASTSSGRTSTWACRRTSGATTVASSAGSRVPAQTRDVLADDDLERAGTGDRLARRYDLIVFPGHEEYVTTHAYDVDRAVPRPRRQPRLPLGEQLLLPRRAARPAPVQDGQWRDLGRPEAALVGVQYVDWNRNRYPNRPYTVTGAGRARWLFERHAPAERRRFGAYGIEIDARTSQSPRGIKVLARIGDAFGPGKSAEMTYYETAARREGVRGRRDELRRLGTVAGRLPDGREPLAAAGRALSLSASRPCRTASRDRRGRAAPGRRRRASTSRPASARAPGRGRRRARTSARPTWRSRRRRR